MSGDGVGLLHASSFKQSLQVITVVGSSLPLSSTLLPSPGCARSSHISPAVMSVSREGNQVESFTEYPAGPERIDRTRARNVYAYVWSERPLR